MLLLPKPQSTCYPGGIYALPASPALWLDEALANTREGVLALLPAFIAADSADCAQVCFMQDASLPAEAYRIRCGACGVRIDAHDAPAAVFAASTLMQLLRGTSSAGIPYCEIEDAPRYAWRGMHFDVARHFFPIATLYRLLDVMAVYKFNRFHLHFSDDQGFRLESESLPKLHQVGSRRESSAVRHGAGEVQNGIPHGGYYTKAEIRALVQYAKARGIEVVPELDLPGHTNALLAAYPHLACFPGNAKVVTEFGLRDFRHHILCAGEPQVYEFLCALLDEICELFPFPYIHIGGDEAGRRDWKRCAKCQTVMREQGIRTERDLQGWMLERVHAYLAAKGKRVILWNDALSRFSQADEIVQHWTPKSMEGDSRTAAHLNAGGQAIMSGFRYLYFDYPYAMTPLRKAYEYDFIPAGVRPENEQNIIGLECAMWTEWIETERKVFYNLLPRIAAAAELMWCGAAQRDYDDFVRRLQPHYAMYEDMGLPYAANRERTQSVWKRLRDVRTFFYQDSEIEVR